MRHSLALLGLAHSLALLGLAHSLALLRLAPCAIPLPCFLPPALATRGCRQTRQLEQDREEAQEAQEAQRDTTDLRSEVELIRRSVLPRQLERLISTACKHSDVQLFCTLFCMARRRRERELERRASS